MADEIIEGETTPVVKDEITAAQEQFTKALQEEKALVEKELSDVLAKHPRFAISIVQQIQVALHQ